MLLSRLPSSKEDRTVKARTVENICIGVILAQFGISEIESPTHWPEWIALYAFIALAVASVFIDRWNRRRKGKPDRVRTVEDWCSIGLMFMGVTALWGYRQFTGHYPPFAATE